MSDDNSMYEIGTRDALSFVQDPGVDLPRFQRKSTWRARQRFDLAISAFHGYPVGMVVVRQQTTSKEGKRRKVSYLLDGRQRRETLQAMRNPETIWDWSKAALHFKQGSTPAEIAKLFWTYVDDYFGREAWQVDPGDVEQPVASDMEPEEAVPSLQTLLDVIVAVHPVKKSSSKMSDAFDFSQHLNGLPYVAKDGTKRSVDVPTLVAWLRSIRELMAARGSSYPPSADEFVDFLEATFATQTSRAELERDVATNWTAIEQGIQALEETDAHLRSCRLGYLEIKNCTANDEQKIFEIINSAGTQLTAVEILSAKHQWNREVAKPNEAIRRAAQALYTNDLGIEQTDTIVRWDVAATVVDRLNVAPIIGLGSASDANSKGQFERRVTTGFKLLAGHYVGRIAKDDLSELGYQDDLPWGSQEFEGYANQVHRLLESQVAMYKFWASWKSSLNNRTSDAAAMNYLLLLVRDWIALGKPTAPGANRESFIRSARNLLDRTIYEYVTGVWSGSSDSRIARNLARFAAGDGSVMSAVSASAWETLVDEVIDYGTVSGDPYLSATTSSADPRIVLLLLYSYITTSQRGPGTAWSVDHIIPRRAFNAAESDVRRDMHHIANLALLPEGDNLAKTDDTLCTIASLPHSQDRDWLVGQIEVYTGIREADFGRFCRASAITELRQFRGPALRKALTADREAVLDPVT